MIIKDGTDSRIEQMKQTLGLSGDVYIDGAHHIASLESHRQLLASYDYLSIATTIEEAEIERAAFEAELERRRRELPETDLTLDDTLAMLRELGVNTDDF